jgi:hypothetical protein
LLNIYGDKGNILAIQKRCEWRGINVNIHNINPEETINPEKYDIYFIGGGQDQQQIAVASELQKNKDALKTAAEDNAVFLSICGGYQLLGHYYKPHEGDKLVGISILDAYTVAGNTRYIGNVTIKTDFLEPKTLVGFENHSGLTYLQGNTKPIGKVIVGNGNNGWQSPSGHFTYTRMARIGSPQSGIAAEGARYKNVFGTYLHGSLLPKNPHFTDYLILQALIRKYGADVELEALNDDIENYAHNKAIKRKY